MTAKRTLIKPCQGCGEIHELHVREKDVIAWKNGTLIQNAMPYLSAEERELMISGFCSKCFINMFQNNLKTRM